jgi:hypothetical protein
LYHPYEGSLTPSSSQHLRYVLLPLQLRCVLLLLQLCCVLLLLKLRCMLLQVLPHSSFCFSALH